MSTTTTPATPAAATPGAFYRTGRYAPVAEETTRTELTVRGHIPPSLHGMYVRNGPNPRGAAGHWFTGDGMVHGVELSDGRANWYRNRYVRSTTFTHGAPFVRDDLTIDRAAGMINTNVIQHAGRVLALSESSFPYELTGHLDTLGAFDFDGRLTTAMTAHPKICPTTGELHFFGYGYTAPFLTYHMADRLGRLVHTEIVEVPGATMMHDFAITAQSVVFMDLPVVFDLELAARGTMPYRWSDTYGARIGVLDRAGRRPVRWYEIEPCYVFHVLNAFEAGDVITIDVVRYPEQWRDGPDDFHKATLWRWTINASTGRVTEEELDDRTCEFPRIDDRLAGLEHRIGYGVHVDEAPVPTGSILRYDLQRGRCDVIGVGAGRVPAEPVFVPAGPTSAEHDGYLMTYVYDCHRDGSDLVILDAADPSAKPIAVVELDVRVPMGFHGNWLPR